MAGISDQTHVILAEDDDDDFLIFSLALEGLPLPLTVLLTRAEDGERLMKLLEEKIPDILFLDIYMPCKDGHQCIKEIRANSKYDALPIIVYSSLKDLRTIEMCYRQGSNLYTIKPTSLTELQTAIQRILTIDWKKSLYFPSRSEFVLNPQ